ncbi:hypothetical protein D9M72_649090 [compost metagenome]
MGMVPFSKRPMKGPKGCLSLNSTVSGSSALTDSICSRLARKRACVLRRNTSDENTTSAEVKGLPSCQATPGLSLKVKTVPSLLEVHAVASEGSGLIFSS